jgi:hypothetical protein
MGALKALKRALAEYRILGPDVKYSEDDVLMKVEAVKRMLGTGSFKQNLLTSMVRRVSKCYVVELLHFQIVRS